MDAVHPEDRERAARTFWEGVNSGQGFAFETRSRRAKDGIYRWHLQQAVVLRDAEGKVLRFVGTTTDIDDQKRAEQALAEPIPSYSSRSDTMCGSVNNKGRAAMARLAGFRGFLHAAITVVCALSGRASPAEPLRLVTADYLAPGQDAGDGKVPGFPAEVVGQVFAAMGQDVSLEAVPPKRAWMMIVRGERDGMPAVIRTGERERFCSFPDEPLSRDRWFLFVRTADIGKLNFSSNDDLTGHDVAVLETYPGLYEQPAVPPELVRLLREHHNMVATDGTTESFRMLAAGRVDYAVANINLGMENIARLGLSGKIEPLLSRSVSEEGIYVCFSKARVSPTFVGAFSSALRQFKQTETFRAIYRRYYP
jgi:polar amino acid transport system substrate-binding protein